MNNSARQGLFAIPEPSPPTTVGLCRTLLLYITINITTLSIILYIHIMTNTYGFFVATFIAPTEGPPRSTPSSPTTPRSGAAYDRWRRTPKSWRRRRCRTDRRRPPGTVHRGPQCPSDRSSGPGSWWRATGRRFPRPRQPQCSWTRTRRSTWAPLVRRASGDRWTSRNRDSWRSTLHLCDKRSHYCVLSLFVGYRSVLICRQIKKT